MSSPTNSLQRAGGVVVWDVGATICTCMTKKEVQTHTCRSVFFFFAFIPDSLVWYGSTVTRLSVQRTEPRKYLQVSTRAVQSCSNMKSGWFWPFWRWYALAARIVCIVSWRISSRSEHRRLKWNPGHWSVIRSDQIRGHNATQRNAFWFHPARHRPLPRWRLAAGSLALQAHTQISVRLPGPAGPGSPQICVGYRRQAVWPCWVPAPVPVCHPRCVVVLLSPSGD